ncbi:hypothetical protein JCM17823_01100 [Halorubrum gandharaense]
MTDESDPIDDESFNESLTRLIERAHRNGTDVDGAWKCSTRGSSEHHWDIQITRVEYDEED